MLIKLSIIRSFIRNLTSHENTNAIEYYLSPYPPYFEWDIILISLKGCIVHIHKCFVLAANNE